MTRSVFLHAYEAFRTCLVDARKASAKSQVELAQLLNRPQSFVSKVESGDRRLDVVEFVEICRALDADPAAIVKAINEALERS